MTDQDAESAALDDPDAQPATDAELRSAQRLCPPGTEPMLLGIETDVLDWFRRQGGDDVRALIHRVLKQYVSAHR